LSANILFQGRKFKTKRYKEYREELYYLLPNIKIPKEGELKIDLEFGFSNKRSDIDNPVKGFLDSLKDKYDLDDMWIYELIVKKKIVKKGEEFIKFKIKKYE
jgi:Holliday junction resolvase RusA-like endonuclease